MLFIYKTLIRIYFLHKFRLCAEPKGTVQPRIRVEKHSRKKVKFGEDITLPCLAQGYPLPTYRFSTSFLFLIIFVVLMVRAREHLRSLTSW